MSLGQHPEYYTADNGYLTNESIKYLYRENIKAIIPDRTQSTQYKSKSKNNKFKKSNFKYNWSNDTYTCTENQILKYQNKRKINKVLHNVYSTEECKNCKQKQKCTKSPKKEIFRLADPLRIKMSEDFQSNKGKEIYKKRFHTGENFFAQLISRNFIGIKRKTTKKVQTELTIQSIIHNIKIIHKNT